MELTLDGIDKLEVKTKIVEEKEKGIVVDSYPVTVVKFQVRGTAGRFDKFMEAIAANHSVKVAFNSPQLAFDITKVATETAQTAKV